MTVMAQTQAETPRLMREPKQVDYFIFFVGIPVSMAVFFSIIGMRLIVEMPFLDGLAYLILHMFVAWWLVALGAFGLKHACRAWEPPQLALCVMGFILAIIPAAFCYKTIEVIYTGFYPEFAALNANQPRPGWNIDYLLAFLAGAIPALPLFIAGIFGYRSLGGVDWLGYDEPADIEATAGIPESLVTGSRDALTVPTAGLINGSRLPADAVILAIKAEQHYVHIWSSAGKDLVRFRFSDLAETLAGCNGGQVHRSWWVNYGAVDSWFKRGRKLELKLTDELTVPVSLAYQNGVLEHLDA